MLSDKDARPLHMQAQLATSRVGVTEPVLISGDGIAVLNASPKRGYPLIGVPVGDRSSAFGVTGTYPVAGANGIAITLSSGDGIAGADRIAGTDGFGVRISTICGNAVAKACGALW